MGELSMIDRVRITLAGWAFLLAGRLWPDLYDVWLDDAPRKTHLPGDDEFGSEFDYENFRLTWYEALLAYDPPDPIPAGGWHRLMPDSDEADRIFRALRAALDIDWSNVVVDEGRTP